MYSKTKDKTKRVLDDGAVVDMIPYYTMNFDYSEELVDDQLMAEIKSLCLTYLADGLNSIKVDKTIINNYNMFLVEQLNRTKKLKSTFKFDNINMMSSEISHTINLMTMTNKHGLYDIDNFDMLKMQVNSYVESIIFCYAIMSEIEEEFYA